MRDNRLISLQTIVGFTTLILVLVSALALGANRPVAWSLLTFAILPFFALHTLRALINPLPHQLNALLLPVLLYLGVLGWAAYQLTPGPSPDWIHPFWSAVPGAEGVISGDPGQGRQALVRLALYGMIFLIAATTFTRPDAARWAIRVFAIWSTLLAIFGFYALATGNNPIVDTQGSVMLASFVNRNSYATYAGFGAIANIGIYLSVVEQGTLPSTRHRWRNMIESFFGGGWVYAVGAILCLAAVALTAFRAGSIATLIGLATFALAWAFKRQDGKASGLMGSSILLFAGFAALIGFIAYASAGTLIGRLLGDTSEELRFVVFPHIIDLIMERPLLGHGLGSFQSVFRQAVPFEAGVAEWDLAHSSYLENTLELGVPAAIAFYFALALVGARILRGVRTRRRDRSYTCVTFACFVVALVHASLDFSLQMPAIASIFAILCGMGWSQSFSERARRKAMVKE